MTHNYTATTATGPTAEADSGGDFFVIGVFLVESDHGVGLTASGLSWLVVY